MNWRNKLALGLSGLLVLFAFYKGCQYGKPKLPTVLPVNDKEQIIIDPVKHQLIILRPGGDTITTLPDRRSVIDIKKDGSVIVTAKQMGFETRPFIGLGLGSGFRGYVGADLFFFKKLDVGLGAVTPQLNKPELTDTRAGLFVSYIVYDNTRATLGFDTSKTVHLLISVRI
jgi:hypothetical protein